MDQEAWDDEDTWEVGDFGALGCGVSTEEVG